MELTFCHGRKHKDIQDENIIKTIYIDVDPDTNPDIIGNMLDPDFQNKFKSESVDKMRFIGCPFILFREPKFKPILSKLKVGGQIIIYGSSSVDWKKTTRLFGQEETIFEMFQGNLRLFSDYGYLFDMKFKKGINYDRFIYTLIDRLK